MIGAMVMGSIEDFLKKFKDRSLQEMAGEPLNSWEDELNRFITKHPEMRKVIELV